MKNTVNAILENLRLNETKSIDLGNGSTAYQYNGSYFIKKGDERREISKDQYDKLKSKDIGSGSSTKSASNKKKKEKYQYEEDFDKEYQDAAEEAKRMRQEKRNGHYTPGLQGAVYRREVAKTMRSLQKSGISPEDAIKKFEKESEDAFANVRKLKDGKPMGYWDYDVDYWHKKAINARDKVDHVKSYLDSKNR